LTHSASADQWHTDHVLLGIHQGALDSDGDLTASLAADTHQTVLVAHNGNAAEAHDLATLHDLQEIMHNRVNSRAE
jgi:hypothetical protein